MKLKELFSISIRSPQLNPEEVQIAEKKDILKKRIESTYERLESIEILNSNSKYIDSSLISKDLLYYLIHTLCIYDNKKPPGSIEIFLSDPGLFFENDNLKELIKDNKLKDSILKEDPDEDSAEYLETFISNLLNYLEKKTNQLITPVDKHKTKLKIQFVIFGLLLIGLLYVPINFYFKNKIHPDNLQIYALNSESATPSDSNLASLPLKIHSGWETYQFQFSEPKKISQIRLDPFSQKNIKFQIDYIRFLNSKGEVVNERNFILQKNLLLNDQNQLSNINQLIPGKNNQIGQIAEMKSIGSDPYFHLNMGDMEDISTIEIKLRFTKTHKNFTDSPQN